MTRERKAFTEAIEVALMEFPSEHDAATSQAATDSAIPNALQGPLLTFDEGVIGDGPPKQHEPATRAVDRLETRTPRAISAAPAPLLMLVEAGITPVSSEQHGGAATQAVDRSATRGATRDQRRRALLLMALTWYARLDRTSWHRPGRNLQSAAALVVCVVAVSVMVLFSTTRVSKESVAPSVSVAAVPRPAPVALTSRPTVPDTSSTAQRPSAVGVAAVAQQNDSARTGVLASPKLKRMNANGLRRRTSAAAPLLPAATHPRSLLVSSSPAGGQVFVNGVRVGATPILLRDLPTGSRVVRVDLDGYERWSAAVRIVAGEQTRVMAELRRSSSR